MTKNVASPCINVCEIHAKTQLCTGCLRTLDEIAAWGSASTAHKHQILHNIQQRKSTHPTPKTQAPSC